MTPSVHQGTEAQFHVVVSPSYHPLRAVVMHASTCPGLVKTVYSLDDSTAITGTAW
jgi:hypothetical protein